LNGITAAFTGRIGKDAEIRNTRSGAPWAAFPVAVDTDVDSEAGTAWVRVALFGETVDVLAEAHQGRRGLCRGSADPAPLDGCGW
jgi:single-stranded DNA-binding protein